VRRAVRLGLVLLLAVRAAGAGERPHVVLVVVDGLGAAMATPARMPRLFAAVAAEPAHASVFHAARAVMPARTNPNHVSLLTGVHPGAHGITGNAYWSGVPGAPPARLGAAALIEVETLITVIETDTPARRTVSAFGKPKLARLLAAVPGRQRAADVAWSPETLAAARRDRDTGYARDADTMAALVAAIREAPADFAVVNLADVDRTAHARGPGAAETAAAVAGADTAIGVLVDALRAAGEWARTVLIVTADHGFTDVAPTPARPDPVIVFGRRLADAGVAGIVPVADGGVEHVYAGAGPLAAARLAAAAALARATPGVAEVLARTPVPGVPALAAAHPGWHLDHPRTGDLLLVAAAGFVFVDPWDPVDARLRGNHGGPADTIVPLVVVGGSPALRAAPADAAPPSAVDVAPTVASLLGVRLPRRLDGAPLAPSARGRVLRAILADAQSPH
jgi:arylsulfatase A-like enzyme